MTELMVEADRVIAAMGQPGCILEVVRRGCRLLAELADMTQCRRYASSGGIGDALVAALHAHPDDGDVARPACTALAHLVEDPDWCMPAQLGASIAAAVHDALLTHIHEEATVDAACRVLQALVENDDDAAVREVAGAAEQTVLMALDMHCSSIGCARDALGALAALTALTAVEPLPERVRATSVLTALCLHCRDAGMADAGCAILATLPDGHRRALVDDGAGPALASVLRVHAGNARIAAAACNTLTWLAAVPECNTGLIRDRVWEAVAAALRLCVANMAAVRAACGVLRILAAASDGPTCAGMADAAGAGVIEALHRHARGARDVVIAACDVLALLATTPECCVALCAGGVVGAVVGALGAHSADAGVAAAACLLVSALSVARDARQPLVDGGAGAAVMAALEAHAGVVKVVQPACCALRSLCDTGLSSSSVAAPACGAAMFAALKTHGRDVDVARAACGTLARLSTVEANCLPLVRVDACVAVRSALSRHSGNRAVARAACTTLCNTAAAAAALPEGSAQGAALLPLVGEGTVAALASALQAHTGDVVVARASLSALRHLAAAGGNLTALRQHGRTAWTAMERHATDPDVALAGCDLLRHLADVPTLQPDLCDAGAAVVLVAALSAHVGGMGVVRAAIVAFSQLAAYKANLPYLGPAQSGIAMTMAAHPGDPHVQRDGRIFLERMGSRVHALG